MKTLSDILRSEPVWVNPAHVVEAAIVLMRGLDLGGLPVLDGQDIVGIVQDRHLMGVDKRKRVEDVMDRHVVTLPLTASIREAAEILMREKTNRLLVVRDDGSLAGMISEGDLLCEMRRPVDPITDLHWSDSLREWAIEQLQAGQEITLLFIDIDDFGMFNKKHGHVIGDAVLKNVAGILTHLADSSRDIACRYGGDEFCVATLRNAIEASAMAEIIERSATRITVDDVPELSVSVTVGLRGGKRGREREHVHYVATLNNLINLASRDCILKKASRRSVEASLLEAAANHQAFLPQDAIVESLGRDGTASHAGQSDSSHPILTETLASTPKTFLDGLRLSALGVTRTNGIAQVHVELERIKGESGISAPAAFTGDASGQAEGDSLRRVVAEATVEALRQALPSGYDIHLEEVLFAQTADGRRLITVAGQFVTPTDARPIAGSVFSGADPNRAVAAAVLSATNRQLARLPFPMQRGGEGEKGRGGEQSQYPTPNT